MRSGLDISYSFLLIFSPFQVSYFLGRGHSYNESVAGLSGAIRPMHIEQYAYGWVRPRRNASAKVSVTVCEDRLAMNPSAPNLLELRPLPTRSYNPEGEKIRLKLWELLDRGQIGLWPHPYGLDRADRCICARASLSLSLSLSLSPSLPPSPLSLSPSLPPLSVCVCVCVCVRVNTGQVPLCFGIVQRYKYAIIACSSASARLCVWGGGGGGGGQ